MKQSFQNEISEKATIPQRTLCNAYFMITHADASFNFILNNKTTDYFTGTHFHILEMKEIFKIVLGTFKSYFYTEPFKNLILRTSFSNWSLQPVKDKNNNVERENLSPVLLSLKAMKRKFSEKQDINMKLFSNLIEIRSNVTRRCHLRTKTNRCYEENAKSANTELPPFAPVTCNASLGG